MPRESALKLLLHNRTGMVGVVIIVFFGLMALLAPYIAGPSPAQTYVTGPWAVPAWATAFPQYWGLPPNLEAAPPSLTQWAGAAGRGAGYEMVQVQPPPALVSKTGYSAPSAYAALISAAVPPGSEDVVYTANYTFNYRYRPPYEFKFGALVEPLSVDNISDFYLRFLLVKPDGQVVHLTSYSVMSSSFEEDISYNNGFRLGNWNVVYLSTTLPDVNLAALGPSGLGMTNTGLKYLDENGNYTLVVQVVALGGSSPGSLKVELAYPFLFVYGRQYGLLGSDNRGRDLWSQFVWGSRISMEVGLLASIFTVIVGMYLGVISGAFGGLVDETLMRIADIFLVIPFLPLAIILVFMITQSAFLAKELYLWLIVLFAVLSWPAVARVIRSQTLTVKERGYVEAARALGAGRGHIISRHILPNIMSLVYANLALNVPGFILTEAALDFLFPGASTVPTWGRMLSKAFDYASSAIYYNFGWWWFIFPGIAIVLLSLSFVLLGYALDEIFNPRLRRR
ncbi:MAG: ABC transporter permease [Nitrososphaeria archaeon]